MAKNSHNQANSDKQNKNLNEDVRKSLTHERPDPKSDAPQSRSDASSAQSPKK
jgi:hypothetical protein